MSNFKQFKIMRAFSVLGMLLAFLVISCQDLNLEDPQAEEILSYGDNANLFPGRFIVTLHSNEITFRKSDRYEDVQAGMRKLAHDVLIKYDIEQEKLTAVYGHVIKGFALELTSEEYKALSKDPKVKSIEQDTVIPDLYGQRKTPPGRDKPNDGDDGSGTGDPEPGTGGTVQNDAPKYLDRIDQRKLPLNNTYTYTATGKGVTAYVPIGAIWEEYDGIMDRVVNINLTDVEEEELNGSTTNMALTTGGLTYGPAKGVKLVGIKTRDGCCDSTTYLSAIITAYDWILANGERPGVVLTLLVNETESASYFTALESLYHAGFALFSSSGAWMVDACTWPSSYKPYVFTVGMTDLNDRKQKPSNYGDCIDLFTTCTDFSSKEDGYHEIWKEGINMNPNFVAVGVVAGVAAKYLENNPLASPDEVYHFLRSTSTKNVVQLSNSVNNHLLFSGKTQEGAGEIDPERTNSVLDLIGSSTKARGNKFLVHLEWNPFQNPTGEIDIYEDGKKIAVINDGGYWSGGIWTHQISGKTDPRTYKICLSGTGECSNEVTVTF